MLTRLSGGASCYRSTPDVEERGEAKQPLHDFWRKLETRPEARAPAAGKGALGPFSSRVLFWFFVGAVRLS